MKLRVASRESRLAVIQSELVMEGLSRLHPELELELVTMKDHRRPDSGSDSGQNRGKGALRPGAGCRTARRPGRFECT